MKKPLNRSILCIDLKSFFASCECIQRNLDPFKTPLVVADPKRGSGAITLAITPYMKSLGIKSRGRIYEIPRNIKYIIAKPRMNLYVKKSTEVINIYLDFIAKEDLYVYSIDECFLDITSYLSMYKKTDYELTLEIVKEIYLRTGLSVTVGIGPNMLLAKLALDLEGKKKTDSIAKWSYEDVKEKLWTVTPLSKMWGIGGRMEKRLNLLGIFTVGELANYDKGKLKKKFGVIGEELWDHANGIDFSTIKDWSKPSKEKSINHSQVLFKDYFNDSIYLIIREMIETLLTRLRGMRQITGLVGFGISYSKATPGGFYHSMKLNAATNNRNEIYNTCLHIFDKYYVQDTPIRKVSISFGRLEENKEIQLNLFENDLELTKRNKVEEVTDTINDKFGKNTILRATSLIKDSTIRERNKKRGGHHE